MPSQRCFVSSFLSFGFIAPYWKERLFNSNLVCTFYAGESFLPLWLNLWEIQFWNYILKGEFHGQWQLMKPPRRLVPVEMLQMLPTLYFSFGPKRRILCHQRTVLREFLWLSQGREQISKARGWRNTNISHQGDLRPCLSLHPVHRDKQTEGEKKRSFVFICSIDGVSQPRA